MPVSTLLKPTTLLLSLAITLFMRAFSLLMVRWKQSVTTNWRGFIAWQLPIARNRKEVLAMVSLLLYPAPGARSGAMEKSF